MVYWCHVSWIYTRLSDFVCGAVSQSPYRASGLDGREGSCRLLFNRFKDALIGRFGANVEVTGEGTPTSTGWFEVEVSGVGLVFSKKNGDGFVDSQTKLDAITDAIEKAMRLRTH
ncbi:Selenoprotein W [Echinococcus granulosus]|uniref:Selenoprotein W n=1 Tax=Echinococcus granulosus TaxID=6210 RepID=W6V1I8_ECHGR|nr:Selenoprotein W [Echinococcus granulosus]EUB64802.1 Selenoprotein W [Echinococcus granulosus]